MCDRAVSCFTTEIILSPALISNGVPKTEKLDGLLAGLVIS